MTHDAAFPSGNRENVLCMLALEMVRARPGMPGHRYIDPLVIACQPDRYGVFLLEPERGEFVGLMKRRLRHPGSPARIPWRDIRRFWGLHGAIEEGEDRDIWPGKGGPGFRHALASLPAIETRIVELLSKATDRLWELQGYTVQV